MNTRLVYMPHQPPTQTPSQILSGASPVCHTQKRKPVCLHLGPSDTHRGPAWNKARRRRCKTGLGRAGRWLSRGCRSLRTLPGPGRRLQAGGRRGKATWSRPGEGQLRAASRGRRGAYSAHEAGAPVACSATAAGGSDSGRGWGSASGGDTGLLGDVGGDLPAVRMPQDAESAVLRIPCGLDSAGGAEWGALWPPIAAGRGHP